MDELLNTLQFLFHTCDTLLLNNHRPLEVVHPHRPHRPHRPLTHGSIVHVSIVHPMHIDAFFPIETCWQMF